MTDFCIESTAIHEEYVEEFNSTFSPLIDKLPNTQFVCITSHPDNVIKRKNLKVVDVKQYTSTTFKKRFDHEGGFCEILQATRFGLHEAYKLGYTKVIHLNTDITYVDEINEDKLSNHLDNINEGIYYDMSWAFPVYNRIENGDEKTTHLAKCYNITKDEQLKLPVGDEPVVMFNFQNQENYSTFLQYLEELCKETFKHSWFETGIGVEMSFATHLTGMKSVLDYTVINKKYFDVNNSFLYNDCYDDKDPKTVR